MKSNEIQVNMVTFDSFIANKHQIQIHQHQIQIHPHFWILKHKNSETISRFNQVRRENSRRS